MLNATNTAGTTLLVNNNITGLSHGIVVGQTSTVVSGGTNSSSLTLADNQVLLGVGTATTSEIDVLTAFNNGTATSVTIGGSSNELNLLQSNATGGMNIIEADSANTISALYAGGTNTIQALGTNGTNNLTANATTGTNNIEAYTNNIGVATANSVNTIGNAGTSTNTITGLTNTIEAATNNIGVGTTGSVNTIGNAGTSTNVITGATNNITGVTTVTSTGTANQMIVDATSSRFVSEDGYSQAAVSNGSCELGSG